MSPLFRPVSMGGGSVAKAAITSTTGSPTIDTTSRPGKTIYKFTGSGSITVGAVGTAEILVVGGGGGVYTSGGGGGAGGYLYNASALLPAGTLTVTVGTGGTATPTNNIGYNGAASRLGDYYALGGGYGGNYISSPANGGSGGVGGSGGGGANDGVGFFQGGAGTPGQGNAGAAGYKDQYNSYYRGGGGGAGGAASLLNGGAGVANSITGASVTYAAGGSSNSGSAPTANTGNGAGGNHGTGASGIVIVVTG